MRNRIKRIVRSFYKAYDRTDLDIKMRDPRLRIDFYYQNLSLSVIAAFLICLLAVICLIGTFSPFSSGYILPQINATNAYIVILAVNLAFMVCLGAELDHFHERKDAAKRAVRVFNWFTGIDMIMAVISIFSTQADSSFFFEYILITSIIFLVPNAEVRTQVRNTVINIAAMALVLAAVRHTVAWQDAVDIAILHLLCGLVNWFRLLNFLRVEKAKFALEKKKDEFYQDSRTDELTGLLNRTALRSDFPDFIGQKLCVALVDLDHFKQYNDTYGHAYGDEVLIKTSVSMKRVFKDEADHCYRYGGDELLIISAEPEVKRFAQKLNVFKADCTEKRGGVRVTCSIGYAAGTPHSEAELRAFIQTADNYLYRAKNEGVGAIEGDMPASRQGPASSAHRAKRNSSDLHQTENERSK